MPDDQVSESETAYIVDERISVIPPKRQMNPNSLANLKPPWQPGESGHGIAKGPYITPAMKAMCDKYTVGELKALDLDSLRPHEAIAVAALRDAILAIETGSGHASRVFVTNRLDGDIEKHLSVDLGVSVHYTVQAPRLPSEAILEVATEE